jgi:hypothetical protein
MRIWQIWKIQNISGEKWALLLLGIIFLLTNLMSATCSPLTHDEAQTYLHGVMPGIKPLLLFTFNDSNNQVLNTGLMILSTRVFGFSEFALRLPNILASLLYLYCTYWLTRRYRASWPAMIILNAPLPIAAYFSLARGYGIANAFVALAIVFLVRGLDNRSICSLSFSTVAALFSAAANFSYLVVYIVTLFVCIISIIVLYSKYGGILKNNMTYSVVAIGVHAFVGMYLLYPLVKLLKRNAFYIGGNRGFVDDTVMSLVTGLTGKYAFNILPLFVISILSIILLICCYDALKAAKKGDFTPATFIAILICSCCVTVLLHRFLKVNFPTGRAALYYYIIFAIVLLASKHLRYVRYVIALILFVLFTFNYDHRGSGLESDTRTAMRALAADADSRGESIRLAIDWIFEPAVRYYQGRIKAPYEFEVDRTGYPNNRDYYLEHQHWYDPNQTRILRENYNYAYVHQENVRKLKTTYDVIILKEYHKSSNVLCRLE